jgi:hypothetical protein
MAIVRTPTILSLDHYSEIIGVVPAHFNQIVCEAFPDSAGCSDVWMQYAWQLPDKASREDLGRSIAQAEQLIANEVGFWPGETWEEVELHQYPKQDRRAGNQVFVQYAPKQSNLRRKTVQTTYDFFIAGGRRAVSLIESGATVTYSDPDSDGFNELATITVLGYSGSATAKEIALFHTAETYPENEIRNIETSISGTTITITGESAYFVDPDMWESGNLSEANYAVDGDNPDSFVDTVNVYRVYNSSDGNDNAPVEFAWQRNCSLDFGAMRGILQVWDYKQGIVTPIPALWQDGSWSLSSWRAWNEPDLLKLWYLSGVATDRFGRVREPWARAVAALATALTTKPICGCEAAENLIQYWQRVPDSEDGWTFEQRNCPFGPQMGAWEAYQIVKLYNGARGMALPR